MKIPFTMITKFNYTVRMKYIAIIYIISIAIAGCNQRQQTLTAKKEESKTDSVKVFLLAKDSVQKTITLPGELVANENVQIRAKVQGFIRKINVDIGSKVRK